MLEAWPGRKSRAFRTLHTAQGVATFRRTLDMRDDHPAKKLLTGLCAIGVLTPRSRDSPDCIIVMAKQMLGVNGYWPATASTPLLPR